MKVIKALLGALAITAISIILLSLIHGKAPKTEKILWDGGLMFVPAFIVLLLYDKKQS